MRNMLHVAAGVSIFAMLVYSGSPDYLSAQGGRASPASPARPGQAAAAAPSGSVALKTLHVQGNVHLIAGAGANIVVQVGNLGAVVVDTGIAQSADDTLAAIQKLSTRPIRYIINTHAHGDHTGANGHIAAAGSPVSGRGVTLVGAGQTSRAEIIAFELVLNRMSAPSGSAAATPVGDWPTSTFSSNEKDFFTNDEAVQIIHQPTAHTDGDSIVFFRRSDVIATGDVYSTVSYPIIDASRGGSITGVLAALNQLLAVVIAGEKTEGGTMLVPGHGRISDEADLVEYRDMVTIIRDRVQDMINRGMTLDQVKVARPTMEYDGLYGSARGWTSDQFVEAVFRGLKP